MCRQFGAHTCQSNFLPSWSRHPYTCAFTGTHCTDADAVFSRGRRFTSNISLQPPASKIEYNLESTWWTMMMQWCTRHQCWWISAPGEVDATTLESMSPPIFTLHPLHDPHFVSSDQPWFDSAHYYGTAQFSLRLFVKFLLKCIFESIFVILDEPAPTHPGTTTFSRQPLLSLL